LAGTGLSGQRFDLAGYRGRVTVVQYWATWCEPCKRDMATLGDLLKKYSRAGLAVVGVNLDANREDAAAYVKSKKLPWVNLYEDGGLNSRYAQEMGIFTLPAMLLIDKQGRVANRSLHISQLENELKKLLQ
jgi:thiol-disulfide isomerase/thioredoxin